MCRIGCLLPGDAAFGTIAWAGHIEHDARVKGACHRLSDASGTAGIPGIGISHQARFAFLQFFQDEIYHIFLYGRTGGVAAQQVAIGVQYLGYNGNSTIAQEQFPVEIGAQKACFGGIVQLVLFVLRFGQVGVFGYIVDTGDDHVALADAAVEGFPGIAQLGCAGRAIIVADIERGACAAVGKAGFCQVSSGVQPRAVNAVCPMAQEIVGIKMELFHQGPVAEHLFAGEFVAGLFVQEITEGVFARGERHRAEAQRKQAI